jgi:hypothetical protein
MRGDELIRRAMREMGRRRMANLTAEERQALARKAGKARWENLTKAEQDAMIEQLQARLRVARAKRRDRSSELAKR